jgi:hypothetical protein
MVGCVNGDKSDWRSGQAITWDMAFNSQEDLTPPTYDWNVKLAVPHCHARHHQVRLKKQAHSVCRHSLSRDQHWSRCPAAGILQQPRI